MFHRLLFLSGIVVSFVFFMGCETIHTGILGDISTGMKPTRALKAGDIYHDPQNRFSLTITDDRNLLPRQTKEGVVLEGKAIDRGDVVYGALVYEIPSSVMGTDQEILKATWDGLVEKAKSRKGNLHAVQLKETVCDGLACLEVYFRSEQGAHSLKRGYISRFVKKGRRVYNFYYSYVSMYQSAFDTEVFNSPVSFNDLQEPANNFFAGVRFN